MAFLAYPLPHARMVKLAEQPLPKFEALTMLFSDTFGTHIQDIPPVSDEDLPEVAERLGLKISLRPIDVFDFRHGPAARAAAKYHPPQPPAPLPLPGISNYTPLTLPEASLIPS